MILNPDPGDGGYGGGGGGGGGWADPGSDVYPDGTTSDGRRLGPPGPNGWWDPILKVWRAVTSPFPRPAMPDNVVPAG